MNNSPLYWLEFATGHLWVAHAVEGLVAGLIPGYLSLEEADRQNARRIYATARAQDIQTSRLTQAIIDKTISIEDVSDEILVRLLSCDPDDSAPWTYDPLPLILVSGPDSGWGKPAGRVTVIDVQQGGSMLLSLAGLGVIRSLGLITGGALIEHPLGL